MTVMIFIIYVDDVDGNNNDKGNDTIDDDDKVDEDADDDGR